MKRMTTIGCSAVLALGVLAGCGSDDGSDDSTSASGGSGGDYCSQVEDVKGATEDLSSADTTLADLQSQIDSMRAAEDSAPGDVSGSWGKMADASDGIVSALKDAGVKEDDKLQETLQSNRDAAMAMQKAGKSAPNLQKDTEAISKSAKSECDIDLGSGSSSP